MLTNIYSHCNILARKEVKIIMKINLLRAKMALKGDFQENDLSKVIDVSTMGVHKRMNGEIQFKPSEIKAIAIHYDLTPEEITEIFDLGGEIDESE